MPYSTKTYTVIWRIDGEFMSTDVELTPEQERSISSNDLIVDVIREEHQPDFSEQEIEELVAVATNPDHHDFQGYEIIAAFHAPEIKYLSV